MNTKFAQNAFWADWLGLCGPSSIPAAITSKRRWRADTLLELTNDSRFFQDRSVSWNWNRCPSVWKMLDKLTVIVGYRAQQKGWSCWDRHGTGSVPPTFG